MLEVEFAMALFTSAEPFGMRVVSDGRARTQEEEKRSDICKVSKHNAVPPIVITARMRQGPERFVVPRPEVSIARRPGGVQSSGYHAVHTH